MARAASNKFRKVISIEVHLFIYDLIFARFLHQVVEFLIPVRLNAMTRALYDVYRSIWSRAVPQRLTYCLLNPRSRPIYESRINRLVYV